MDHVKHEIMHDFMLLYTLLDSVFLTRVPVGQYSFFVDSDAFDTDRASHTYRQLLIYSKYFKWQEGGRQAINSPGTNLPNRTPAYLQSERRRIVHKIISLAQKSQECQSKSCRYGGSVLITEMERPCKNQNFSHLLAA